MGKLLTQPTVMKHDFSRVPKAEIPRSQFNRSHGFKTTFDAGYLVPVFLDEALPGDTFNLRMASFARLATPIAPFMDNLFCDCFFFFVPYRLLWTNWEKFNGAQDNPGDSTSFTVPQQVAPANPGYSINSVQDYLGLPAGTTIGSFSHSAFPLRAYNLIYNTWFRDENLQNSVTVDTGNGPDTVANYVLLRRGKRHDYFTSCLPWPQKGTAVSIPLGTSAPLISGATIASGTYLTIKDSAGATAMLMPQVGSGTYGGTSAGAPTTPILADLTNATAATINSLRQAFQIQKLYERDARGGTRYTEILKSHFGVTSPDYRLQRPEYLGGNSTPIRINPVAQSSVTAATPQGNLAAFGTMSQNGAGFVKSFTEHGVVMGIVSIRADLNYQQGLNKMWTRSTRWDFYWPALSHIGEQAVLNQEIYCVDNTGAGIAQNIAVFGYQERYAEYRYKPSLITGQFRSTYTTPLDVWHLAQKFTSLPALNATFIVDNPPIARVSAVPVTGSQFLFDAYFDLKTARPMPTYSVPGLIDHF